MKNPTDMTQEELVGAVATMLHIQEVQKVMKYLTDELTHLASRHDRSKLEDPEELKAYGAIATAMVGVTFGSPGYKRIIEDNREAVTQHKANNSHHPEAYGGVDKMSLLDLLEMLADWKAASKRNGSEDTFLSSCEELFKKYKVTGQLRDVLRATVLQISTGVG